ncbi:MAG TPA: hypothetical protein VEZ11_19125 [Thermoanaerobaculia bacterium]|nr:hypothetical protein [Thermoanaerobaculia bacterium]
MKRLVTLLVVLLIVISFDSACTTAQPFQRIDNSFIVTNQGGCEIVQFSYTVKQGTKVINNSAGGSLDGGLSLILGSLPDIDAGADVDVLIKIEHVVPNPCGRLREGDTWTFHGKLQLVSGATYSVKLTDFRKS